MYLPDDVEMSRYLDSVAGAMSRNKIGRDMAEYYRKAILHYMAAARRRIKELESKLKEFERE